MPAGVAGWAPVPLTATVWGLPLALSVTLTAALRVPVAVGVNFTPIVQLAPAATPLAQVFVCEKSPAFVPVSPMLVTFSAAVPVSVSVTLWAALVEPIFCELNVRLDGDRLTAGVGVGAGVPPPPPPPQAAHTPTTSRAVPDNRIAGRRRTAVEPRSMVRASDPASSQSNPTGKRRLGGDFLCRAGGALVGAVVVMVSVLVTAEALLTVTDAGEIVQVAPVGQPLPMLRLTVPVKPATGVTVSVDVPDCPGAEMVTGEGFADRVKPETLMVAASNEVEPA